jgi:hypothetical protein
MTEHETGKRNEWLYRTSKNRDEIEEFINEHGPSPDGIQAGVSNTNLHVWLRDEHSRYRYSIGVGRWEGPSRTGDEITRMIEEGNFVFLGFEENTYYYLRVIS